MFTYGVCAVLATLPTVFGKVHDKLVHISLTLGKTTYIIKFD